MTVTRRRSTRGQTDVESRTCTDDFVLWLQQGLVKHCVVNSMTTMTKGN